MLTSAAGIGYLVTRYRTILDSPHVFGAIVMILLLSILFDTFARAIERRTMVWQTAGRKQSEGEVAEVVGERRRRRFSSDLMLRQPAKPAPRSMAQHASAWPSFETRCALPQDEELTLQDEDWYATRHVRSHALIRQRPDRPM